MHKINRELIGICGFATLFTAFIYSLNIFVLPEIFNWAGQRMDIRNLILILFSIVILSISGIMISAIIYLMGAATMGIQAVKSGALLLYIRKNRNGILFFVPYIIWRSSEEDAALTTKKQRVLALLGLYI